MTDDVRAIARAVNCGRWSTGVLRARGGAAAASGERWSARVQCLARAPGDARLAVRARFLQLESACSSDGLESRALAHDRQVDTEPASVSALAERPAVRAISFPGLAGELSVRVEAAPGGYLRVTAELTNLSAPAAEPLASAFLSAHLLLGLERGTFVSLDDPAPEAREAAASCRSDGLRAALVGAERESAFALASPAILSDGPKLAADAPA